MNPNGKQDETPLKIRDKLLIFFAVHWRGVVCFCVPIMLLTILAPFPTQKYKICGYCLLLMAIFWITEVIPLSVTSLLPIIIFPLTGVMSTAKTCGCYMNETIVMFLGSMFLGYSVEESGLHKRLALCAIRCIGYSHYKLLFALAVITTFISLWITNTAATTVMVPINFALLKVFEDLNLLSMYVKDSNGRRVASNITTCYFCCTTFTATIGGIGTLTSTVTNLVFKGLFMREYPEAPEYLAYPEFSAFSLPLMIVIVLCIYVYLIFLYFGFLRPHSDDAKAIKIPHHGIEAAKKAVEQEWKKLGSISYPEIMIILIFLMSVALFFCRSPQIFIGWGDQLVIDYNKKDKKFLSDASTAMFASFLIFLFPASLNFLKNFTGKHKDNLPTKAETSLLNWESKKGVMPFHFMFLLGGGFALATAARPQYTNFNGEIGVVLHKLAGLPNPLIMFLMILFTLCITNFMSNVAVCNIIVPISMTLAKQIDQNPLWYAVATGVMSSFCFCIPIATPGNLIVKEAASIPTSKMVIAGIGPTVAGAIFGWIFIMYWAPVIWPDIKTMPSWTKN